MSSAKGSKGGRLWSNVIVEDELEACGNDIFKTNLDARRNAGLEGRGSEQYLSQLVSKKAKKFVAPQVLKAKLQLNYRGRGRGRGFGRGGRGGGRGRGKAAPRNPNYFEQPVITNLKKITEEKKPKIEEGKLDLRGLFGGTNERRGRGGSGSARAFPAAKVTLTSKTVASAASAFSEDAMDVDMESTPPNNGEQMDAPVIAIEHGDLNYNF